MVGAALAVGALLECVPKAGLKPFPAPVAGREVVPEFNIVLTLFPAEENFLPGHVSRKIDQPAIQIFDLNFALPKSLQNIL